MKNFLREASASFSLNEGSKEFIRIYQPFLDKWGIENFYYARITKKGKLIYLTNRADYLKDYWEEGLPLYTGFAESPKEVIHIACQWEGVIDKEIMNFTKIHGCFDGFTFCDRHYDTVQFATFLRSYPIDNPNKFYLEHQNELLYWLREFEWEQRHLIGKAEENPITLPEEYLAPQITSFNSDRTIQLHYRSIRSKITLREMDCLFLFCRGFTVPFIADLLGLSPRTVETHLESVKNRFGLFSRDDLAALAYANPIIQTYAPRLSGRKKN